MSDVTDAKIVQNGYSDEQLLIANNTFELDGYEFQSWNTKSDGTGETVEPSSYKMFQTDASLYAQWKLVYVWMQLVRRGEVKVESNIASSFSTSAGVRTKDAFKRWDTSSSFDLVLHITTGDDVTTKQVLLRLTDIAYTRFEQLCIENGKLVFTSGYSLDKNNTKTGSAELKASTSYFLKVVKSGSAVQFYLSSDGESYQLDLTSKVKYNAGSSDCLEFGTGYDTKFFHSYSYTYQVQEPYTYTEYHWDTNGSCCYYSDIYKKHKFSSDNSPHRGKRGCGREYSVTKTGYKTVTKTAYHSWYTYHCCAGFDGSIDFNQSYFIFEGLKHKLRA